MRKSILTLAVVAAATMLSISCADQGAGNVANKPANTTNTTNTNSAASSATAEAEVKKIIDTTQAALSKNDADAMDKIYADNYMTVNQDGSTQTRAERLAALRSGDTKYDSFTFSDTNIRVNPDGNSAIAITKLVLKGMFKGKSMDGTYRVTGIYNKTKDGWKLAGSQSTRIEADSTQPETKAPANAVSNTSKAANTNTTNK
jgi:ketosteroid isomerase-like protein